MTDEFAELNIEECLDSIKSVIALENSEPLAKVLHINHISSSLINYLIHEKYIQFGKITQTETQQI